MEEIKEKEIETTQKVSNVNSETKPKSKFARWKEGMKNLSPGDQIQAKYVGHIGNVIGILFAAVYLVMKGMWYFIFVMIFGAFIEFINVIGARQQLVATKAVENLLKQAEQEVN